MPRFEQPKDNTRDLIRELVGQGREYAGKAYDFMTEEQPNEFQGRKAMKRVARQFLPNPRSNLDMILSSLPLLGGMTKEASLMSRSKGSWPEHIQNIIDTIVSFDTKKVPDIEYKGLLSTYGKAPLKRGETWRSRAMKFLESLQRNEELRVGE